jgi:hypothetical protein
MSEATAGDELGKRLDVRARLEYALAAVSVLRSLELTSRTMQYKHLGLAIGLISPEIGWKPWHRQQIAEILQVVAAVERQAGPKTGAAPIQFATIVTAEGQPGAGVSRDTRIVSTAQPPSSSD